MYINIILLKFGSMCVPAFLFISQARHPCLTFVWGGQARTGSEVENRRYVREAGSKVENCSCK